MLVQSYANSMLVLSVITSYSIHYTKLYETGDQTETRKVLETLKERRDLTVDLLNKIEGIHFV